jgi:nucleotide-binding universal stress UspA family protein
MKCHLVHAVPDGRVAKAIGSVPVHVTGGFEQGLADARKQIAKRLHGVVPPACIGALDVRAGRAARVLADAVARHRAVLMVLGGKHRSILSRALSGSTARYLIRILDVPVLVTGRKSTRISRVLAAVDLSPAARETLRAAAGLASSVGARLRVVHVVEPIRYPLVIPRAPDRERFFRESVGAFKRLASPYTRAGEAEMVVRRGSAEVTIVAEATRWRADVVVVGSQGKGFVDRLLIGSATEWLLSRLAASLLVVPFARAKRR